MSLGLLSEELVSHAKSYGDGIAPNLSHIIATER